MRCKVEGADAGEVVATITRPLAVGEEEPLVNRPVYLGSDCRPWRTVRIVEDAHGDEGFQGWIRCLALGPGRV